MQRKAAALYLSYPMVREIRVGQARLDAAPSRDHLDPAVAASTHWTTTPEISTSAAAMSWTCRRLRRVASATANDRATSAGKGGASRGWRVFDCVASKCLSRLEHVFGAALAVH